MMVRRANPLMVETMRMTTTTTLMCSGWCLLHPLHAKCFNPCHAWHSTEILKLNSCKKAQGRYMKAVVGSAAVDLCPSNTLPNA